MAGAITNLDVLWDMSDYRRACERLASFSRLILFDKRGMGLSDRVRVGTLEERMDDVRAILDAVGSETAVLMGVSEGGPMSILFAATYPERTRALVLCGAEVKEETTDDWPWGESTREEFEETCDLENVLALGRRALRPILRAQPKGRPAACASSSDAAAGAVREHRTTRVAFMRMAFEIDVRDVVPAITRPTLIVHRVGDKVCSLSKTRAGSPEHRGCALRRAPGGEPRPVDRRRRHAGRDPGVPDRRPRAGRTGPHARDGPVHRHRRLDGPARELGDRRWRDLLERHNEIVRRDLERFRGREIDTAGDGFFATFDGPARAIRCARSIVESVRARSGSTSAQGFTPASAS